MRISIVVPFYNEEDNILPLTEELAGLRADFPDMEIFLVDDGSTDGTWQRIGEAARRHPGVTGLRAPRNTGQSSALLHGLRRATGDVIVTMDGDLQNDPADIRKLVDHIEDSDCVCGFRANRKDTFSRRLASGIANRVRNWVTRDGILDSGCTLKAFTRECIGDLPPLRGMHRFMPAYFKIHGRVISQIPVNHRPRRHGRSKYTNVRRLPRTVCDLFGFWWYRSRLLPTLRVETTGER